MLSCFNLCQCPSVWRWWEFRAQCVSLHFAVDPADQSCRQHSKASAFYSSVCMCVRTCSLINVVAIPFSPIEVPPLKGRLARQTPPLLHCCSPANRRVQLLVILPVFVCCESRCSLKGLRCLFPSPCALSMSPGQSFLDLSLVLDHGSFSGTPSSVQWDESWGLESLRAETLLKLQVSRGSQRPPAKK